MTNLETSSDKIQVRIVLRRDDDDERSGGECVWAQPVHERPGQYMIRNNAFEASLRIEDVVRTELDGCGMPQVVEIVNLHPGPVTMVQTPQGISSDEVGRIADSWRALGSEYSEGGWGLLVTAWKAGVTEQSIGEVIGATAPGWHRARTRWRWNSSCSNVCLLLTRWTRTTG